MKWFHLAYMLTTLVVFSVFVAIGWIVAEIWMAFNAGFGWCQEYNRNVSRNLSKRFGG